MKYKHGCNIKKAFAMLFLCGAVALTGCGNRELEIATGTDAEQDVAETPSNEISTGNGETAESTPAMDESGFYVTDDYVITVGDTINVRVEPNTDASIYELLTAGTVLKRTGYNDEWVRVELDLTSFYIYADYVEVTDPPETTEETTENAAEEDDTEDENSKEKTIVIDPGNQLSMNASTEQVGPGSEETKIGASAGVTGVAQGTTEYSLNLTYALALKEELEERGYTVSITRESNDVNMTNKERAEFANASGAVAYVRIKMNYSTNDALTGVMAATMDSESPYNAELYEESHNLATRLLQGVCESTGATNHGIYESDDMTAVNWSDIPVAVIELGYLSNEEEEAKLLDADYQALVIKGLADGIDLYYN
jgi:N-acetylmuramoyl-L-alanine amidase